MEQNNLVIFQHNKAVAAPTEGAAPTAGAVLTAGSAFTAGAALTAGETHQAQHPQ